MNPHSSKAEFVVGGTSFYAYVATDSHGSSASFYRVGERQVGTESSFYKELLACLRNDPDYDKMFWVCLDYYLSHKPRPGLREFAEAFRKTPAFQSVYRAVLLVWNGGTPKGHPAESVSPLAPQKAAS